MNPLVSPTWLVQRLHDPDVVVLDATLPPVGITPPIDTRARYLARHIPGAVFFDIEALSDRSTSLPHMLPTAKVFSQSMSNLGVDDRMFIVVYEQEGVFSAPRAWWMLRTFGVQDVHILDGGLPAWIEAGFPVDEGPVNRNPVPFQAKLDQNAVKDFTQIRQLIAEHAQILDARSAGRFAGTSPEPRHGLNPGHMPGTINTPFTDLLENGCLKSVAELSRYFSDKDIDIARPITTTCGSGVTAAVIALALTIIGARQVNLYDGSWAEYAQQPQAIIERTA